MQRAYDAHDIVCPPRERVLSIVGLSLREAFGNLGEGAAHFPIDGMIERYREAFFELRHSPEHQEPRMLTDTVAQMRDDENRHGTMGRDLGAEPLHPMVRRAMRLASRVMTGTAYYV